MIRAARSISPWVTGFAALVIAIPFLGFLPAAAQQAPEREHFEADHPEARAAWFSAARQAPAGGQPRAWYYMHAWRHAQRMPHLIPGRTGNGTSGRMSAHMATVSGNWTELGPHPENSGQYGAVAGRVTAIAVDNGKDPSGNTIYIGTAYGGLWKSTDALSANPTFTPIGDTMPTLAVGAIALDSSASPTKIYVGTGEANYAVDSYYGVGILSSTDGGHTWTSASHDTQLHSFFGLTWSRILIDPANPKIVLAAASYSGDYLSQGGSMTTLGLFVSTDGGLTFASKLTGPPCTDLVYDSQTHTYDAVFAGNGIWASSDQGTTWKALSSPFANSIKPSGTNFARASLAARNGVLSVLIAEPDEKVSTPTVCPVTVTSATSCDTGLAQSSDGGNTWVPVAVPGSKPSTSEDSLFCADPNNCQGNFDQYVAMPAGTNDLVIGGIDAFRSSGGNGLSETWTNLTQSYGSGTVHPDEHAFASNADGSVWFIGNDGGIWRSSDKGASWTNLNASLGVIQFISVSADLGQNGVYFGGSQDNGTALSDPAKPLLWNLIWGGDGGYTFDNPVQTQQYFSESPGFEIVRSDDGGKNFVGVVDSTTITDPAGFYVPYAFSPDFTQAYVATTKVWQGPSNPTSPGNGWKAISGDLTGQNCSPTQLPSFLSAIAVAPSDPNTIYVGSSTGAISVSTNATSTQPTWQGLQLSCAHPVGAVAVDPANPKIAYATVQGFLGMSGGHVYATTDGGSSWSSVGNNLPDVPVNSIVIDPNTPQNLFIGTDTGVFVTSDGGSDVLMHPVSWSQLGAGLPATAVLQLKLAQENGTQTLIAATHGRGAWSIPAAAPPNFSLSSDQSSYLVPVTQPQFAFTFHVKLLNGSTSPVQLHCNFQNAGDTCSFSSATVSASSDVTVTVNRPAPQFPDEIVISGQDATHQRDLSVMLNPEDFNIGIEATTPLSLEYGGSLNLSVALSTQYGWSAPVTLDCPGLPSGMTCTATPGSFPSLPQGNTSSKVTLAAASTVAASSPLHVEVDGVSGTTAKKATVAVNLSHFTLALPQGPINVIARSSQFTTTVTASSLSNSQQSIALSCQSPNQVPLQCSFSPATIQPGQSSTLTVTGFPSTGSYYSGFPLEVSGTSGNDSTVSAPVQINIQDFELNASNGLLLTGADSYTGYLGYFSSGGYTTPVNLSCSADHGVQCSVASASVSGNGNTQFTLTHLASLPVGTTVQVTIQASNGDLSRKTAPGLSVTDFQVQFLSPTLPSEADLVPGYLLGKVDLLVVPSLQGPTVPGSFGPVSFACPAAAPVLCSISSMGINAAEVDIDAHDYAKNGGTFPVHLSITATATQNGTSVVRSLDLPVQLEDFSLSPPNGPVALTAGNTGIFTINLNAINNFRNDVSIQCTGAPVGATCTPVGPIFSVPGPIEFHVTTTARSNARTGDGHSLALPVPKDGNGPPDGISLGLSLVGLLLLTIAWQFGLWSRRRTFLQCSGLALLVITFLACGGGGGSPAPLPGTGGGGTPAGTPAGTTTLTITATYDDPNALVGPVHIVHTTTVTLTVQ